MTRKKTTNILDWGSMFYLPSCLLQKQLCLHVPRQIMFVAVMSSSDDRMVTSPSAVGWPPVHTSRRNIVTAMHVTRTTGAAAIRDGPPESTTTTLAVGEKNVAAPPTDSTVVASRPLPANMFAKVHMEGYAIGRKINLRAQHSYDSLSRVLTNMTTNFFCRKYKQNTVPLQNLNLFC